MYLLPTENLHGAGEDAQCFIRSLDWRKRYKENERKFNIESSLSRKKGAFAGQRKLYKASPKEWILHSS